MLFLFSYPSTTTWVVWRLRPETHAMAFCQPSPAPLRRCLFHFHMGLVHHDSHAGDGRARDASPQGEVRWRQKSALFFLIRSGIGVTDCVSSSQTFPDIRAGVFAVIFVAINVLVDVLYTIVDPYVRLG
jgi:hypothetical protein